MFKNNIAQVTAVFSYASLKPLSEVEFHSLQHCSVSLNDEDTCLKVTPQTIVAHRQLWERGCHQIGKLGDYEEQAE